MKYELILFLAILALASCSKPNYYQQTLNDIPTTAPNFNTDIRFASNKSPVNPYFEIIDFNIVEKGAMSKSQVKKRLEMEAVKEGLDAVINVDYWIDGNREVTFLSVLLDVLDENYETTTVTVNYTHIVGRGIMYLESMDFINRQPEYEYFYLLEPISGLPKPLLKIEYKLTGQVFRVYPEREADLDMYKKYFQYYSDFHLLKQRERWTYKMNGPLLTKRILLSRKGSPTMRCLLKYDDNNRLVQVKIIHLYSKIEKSEFVKYSYDKKGMLVKRKVEMHDGSVVNEKYNYVENKLTGKTIIISRPSAKPIKINTSILYYHPDFLKDYYFNEVVKTVQD